MPEYQFYCTTCNSAFDEFLTVSEYNKLAVCDTIKVYPCPKCSTTSKQQWNITSMNTRIGRSWNGSNWGKVFSEHNEKLKKKHGTGDTYLTPTQQIKRKYGQK